MSPTQILAICQNIYEGCYSCNSQWLNGNSCQGQHQAALKAGHLGNSSWITLSGRGGFKWSTVVEWSPATHLIVDILRYDLKKPSVGFRLGTVLVRIRESFHTMLLTISKSKPVSTGRFIANCRMQELLAVVTVECCGRLRVQTVYSRGVISSDSPNRWYATVRS